VTDGRTDGQNYDFQDRASIAESRSKNVGGMLLPTTSGPGGAIGPG